MTCGCGVADSSAVNEKSLSRFERLAGWSRRHRVLAVLLWVVALAGITVGSQAVGSAYHNDNSLPGTQSQQLADLMPAKATDSLQVVAQGDLAKFPALLDKIRAQPHVASTGAPTTGATTAYAEVTLDGKHLPADDVKRIIATTTDGLKV